MQKGIPVKDDAALIPSHTELSPSDIPTIEHDEGAEPEGENSGLATIAVPEHSHPGESASKGLAERSVQMFEDKFKTMKTALDARMGYVVHVYHHIVEWLVEHTSYILTNFLMGPTAGLAGVCSMGMSTETSSVKLVRRLCCTFQTWPGTNSM